MTLHRHLDRCPNCKREFYAHAEGAYCPECWSAWCRNDGTFEQRTVRWADLVATDPSGQKPSDAILALLDTTNTDGAAPGGDHGQSD